jgi:hypothetical protein
VWLAIHQSKIASLADRQEFLAGTSVSAWSRSYTHAGTFRLPMIRAADSCMVVAAVGGSGRVTVQMLAYR